MIHIVLLGVNFFFKHHFHPYEIHSLLFQEESQRVLTKYKVVNSDCIAMLAKNAKYYKNKKNPLQCTHCDTPRHFVDICFQIIGYPSGWRGPRRVKGKADGSNANAMVKSPVKDETISALNPLLNQELFDQFFSFTKMKKGHKPTLISPQKLNSKAN